MVMKAKPKESISSMPSSEAINRFMSGGELAAADIPPTPELAPQEQPIAVVSSGEKITKTIRLSKMLDGKLKDEAYQRSKVNGKRVAESDLIEDALIKYFNI